MAVITLETLVLRGGSVVRDVVTGRAGSGCRAAKRQAPTLPYPMRQPTLRYPSAEHEPVRRLTRVNANDADNAADRAGRPGSGVGMPSRQRLAQSAGLAGRGPRLRAGWRRDRFTVGRRLVLGLAAPALRKLGGTRRLCLRITGGTLPAPTRGTAGG